MAPDLPPREKEDIRLLSHEELNREFLELKPMSGYNHILKPENPSKTTEKRADRPRRTVDMEYEEDYAFAIHNAELRDAASKPCPLISEPKISNWTVAWLAERNPDFLGKVWYYDMNQFENMIAVRGEYVVVYTRPIKDYKDDINDDRIGMPNPHIKTMITVVPRSKLTAIDNARGKASEFNGVWATTTVASNGFQAKLRLKTPDPENRDSRIVEGTVVRIDAQGPNEPKTRLDAIIAEGLNTGDHSAMFGVKVDDNIPLDRDSLSSGFHFIKMTLECTRPEDFKDDAQLVVAVKLPRIGDVSSSELLRQRVRVPPRECLTQDGRLRSFPRSSNIGKIQSNKIWGGSDTKKQHTMIGYGSETQDEDGDYRMFSE